MVSVRLPSDALSQHLPSYLGFSYLGVSLHVCPSTAQPLLLTLDEGYLLTAAPPDLGCGVAPLSHPAPTQLPLLGSGVTPVQVLFSYLFYILWCVYVNLNLAIYSRLLLLTLW